MPFLEWEPRYSVFPDMDAEHKTWFAILNRLHEAMSLGKGKDVQQKILSEILAYTRTHFSHEETLLRTWNYPEFAAHRQLHLGFTAKVQEMEKKMNAGLPVLSLELMDFLRDWLSSHILTQDVKYGAWKKANA